jgi:hypothetical protein
MEGAVYDALRGLLKRVLALLAGRLFVFRSIRRRESSINFCEARTSPLASRNSSGSSTRQQRT